MMSRPDILSIRVHFTILLFMAAILLGCRPAAVQTPLEKDASAALQVVATTTILGDVVQQIGGEQVQVSVLVPPGTDPHSFQPAPGEIRKIADADLVITSGAGLDAFLDRLLENAIPQGDQEKIVSASEGIEFRRLTPGAPGGDKDEPGDHLDEMEIDPHVWFNPGNVIIWTENIERALSQADPGNAKQYAENAESYREELRALDSWVQAEVEKVPAKNRLLVSDHQTLGYFAERYGLQLAGTVIPGSNAAAEPSAEDLAALVDAIRAKGVQAIFVGSTVSPALAQRLAADTGVQVVPIYTDSLTPPGGQASTYLDLMRFDVQSIVEALQ
jgi:ABC-type Zn uptake system ZnuABC Zn-binding protein ZnuA